MNTHSCPFVHNITIRSLRLKDRRTSDSESIWVGVGTRKRATLSRRFSCSWRDEDFGWRRAPIIAIGDRQRLLHEHESRHLLFWER